MNTSMRQLNAENNILDSKREFHYSINKMRNQMNLNGNITNFNNFNNINNGNIVNTYGNIINNINNNVNISNNININNNINGGSHITNSQFNFYNTPNLLQNNQKNSITLNRFKSTNSNSSQGFK